MLMKPLAVHELFENNINLVNKHFLCEDVGGKHNVCEMRTLNQHNNVLISILVFTKKNLRFIKTSFSF